MKKSWKKYKINMGKRVAYTPYSKIVSILRVLWLRSRERAAALKNSSYCCEKCGVKQSKAKGKEQKVEVHHRDGIDWKEVVQLVRDRILQTPDRLKVLCPKCHKEEHEKKT